MYMRGQKRRNSARINCVTSMCHDTQSGRSLDSLNFIRRVANVQSKNSFDSISISIVNVSETVLVNAHASSNIVYLRSGNMRHVI